MIFKWINIDTWQKIRSYVEQFLDVGMQFFCIAVFLVVDFDFRTAGGAVINIAGVAVF